MRGQTTIDFAVGVGVFLIAVVFVLGLFPGLLQPFTSGPQEETVAADRSADNLAAGLLGDPTTPYVLDLECTDAFFEDTSPSECRFAGDDLHERMGLGSRQRVNVSIRGNVTGPDGKDVLCEDGGGGLVEADDGSCSTAFRTGDTPPTGTGSVVVARRVVSIDGTDATLEVRVW